MTVFPVAEYLSWVSKTLDKVEMEPLVFVTERLRQAKEEGQSVFLAGNGGSAATAGHAANDLTKMAGLRAYCLSDMTPTTLAYGNDDGWENMFLHPAEKLLSPNDVIIGISCSGNSPNIVNLAKNRPKSVFFILFTGNGGGEAEKYADLVVNVPNNDIRVQEDAHLALFHAIAGAL